MILLVTASALLSAVIARYHWPRPAGQATALQPLSVRQANTRERYADRVGTGKRGSGQHD